MSLLRQGLDGEDNGHNDHGDKELDHNNEGESEGCLFPRDENWNDSGYQAFRMSLCD